MWTAQGAAFDAAHAFGAGLSDIKHPLTGNTCLHV